MGSSFQEPALDSGHTVFRILYLTQIRLKFFNPQRLLHSHFIMKSCNSWNMDLNSKNAQKLSNYKFVKLSSNQFSPSWDSGLKIAQVASPLALHFFITHSHAKDMHCCLSLLRDLFLAYFYACNVWSSPCMSVPFNWIPPNQNYSCLSLGKNQWFYFHSTKPGSLPGNQTVTPLAVNYPVLCHCFPSSTKLWTIFLPPVIISSHDDALHPLNEHKREIQAAGRDDKQWQEHFKQSI